jgi:hypothetical protein
MEFIFGWILLLHLVDFAVYAKQTILKKEEELFGGTRPWQLPWKTVDDRIRGGSSQSFLELQDNNSVKFYGTLDTTTLGGAGFCSQQFWFQTPINASNYSGIGIRLLSDPNQSSKIYSINLNNKYPKDRGDGRNESQINYKASILANANEIRILWADFKPNYRGKPIDAPSFDYTNIAGLGIMMQSYFDKQQGKFELIIESIYMF